jgi:TonB family protein
MAVSPRDLEILRISGERAIVPRDSTKAEMIRSGRRKVIGSFKLCIDETGTVVQVELLKSTGFSAYDDKLRSGIMKWRYRPYLREGKPAPVCTRVTFVYSQSDIPQVPFSALIKSRTKGTDEFEPDSATKAEIVKDGYRVSGAFQVCVDQDGEVDPLLVQATAETGFPAYDETIVREIRKWTFRPYVLDGKPALVCTSVPVLYRQMKNAPVRPPPVDITSEQIEALRLTGTTKVAPDAATQAEIKQSGDTKVEGTFVVCINSAGRVGRVAVLKTTGYAAYDRKLEAEVRSWTYKPWLVKNKAVHACSTGSFAWPPK